MTNVPDSPARLALSLFPKIGYPTSKRAYVLQKLFGSRLRQLRKNAGITQQDLANRVGVEDYGTIRRWEHGERWPDAATIEKISRALGIRVRDLFTFPDHPHV